MAADATAAVEKAITLTESAARRIAALQSEEENKGLMLRIAVSGGGCQGFEYGFTFDDRRGDDDVLFERDGAVVVVDDISLELLAGSEVDYVEEIVGSYFSVRNPNATSSCGCGNSFSTF